MQVATATSGPMRAVRRWPATPNLLSFSAFPTLTSILGSHMKNDVASFEVRKLEVMECDDVARVLRASFDERLPWLAGLHTPEEDRNFVRGHLFPNTEIWGAFDPALIGFIACAPGWIEQLYVLPGHQGKGVGTALLAPARATNAELRLRAFQRNAGARRFYEHHGFVAIEHTDGSANEEREPDVLYLWTAGPDASR